MAPTAAITIMPKKEAYAAFRKECAVLIAKGPAHVAKAGLVPEYLSGLDMSGNGHTSNISLYQAGDEAWMVRLDGQTKYFPPSATLNMRAIAGPAGAIAPAGVKGKKRARDPTPIDLAEDDSDYEEIAPVKKSKSKASDATDNQTPVNTVRRTAKLPKAPKKKSAPYDKTAERYGRGKRHCRGREGREDDEKTPQPNEIVVIKEEDSMSHDDLTSLCGRVGGLDMTSNAGSIGRLDFDSDGESGPRLFPRRLFSPRVSPIASTSKLAAP